MKTGSPRQIAYVSTMAPPAIDRYQNARGTTLRPVRSLASHCTRKREKKHAWPRKPSASHASAGMSGLVAVADLVPHLPADESPDDVQVRDPAPEPVVDAVLRAARMPGPVADRALHHRVAGESEQGREEAVHPLEAHGL